MSLLGGIIGGVASLYGGNKAAKEQANAAKEAARTEAEAAAKGLAYNERQSELARQGLYESRSRTDALMQPYAQSGLRNLANQEFLLTGRVPTAAELYDISGGQLIDQQIMEAQNALANSYNEKEQVRLESEMRQAEANINSPYAAINPQWKANFQTQYDTIKGKLEAQNANKQMWTDKLANLQQRKTEITESAAQGFQAPDYKQSDLYKEQLQSQQQNIASQFGGVGLSGSGREIQAMEEAQRRLSAEDAERFYGRVTGLRNTGQQAGSQMAGMGQQAAGQLANIYQNQGQIGNQSAINVGQSGAQSALITGAANAQPYQDMATIGSSLLGNYLQGGTYKRSSADLYK